MPPRALNDFGQVLARAHRALTSILRPNHLYIGRYGHTPGHALHFHLIPVCGWVRQCFFDDPRYRVLNAFSYSAANSHDDETDGAELTLFVWREFCENPNPPTVRGPSIGSVVEQLKGLLALQKS